MLASLGKTNIIVNNASGTNEPCEQILIMRQN